MCIITAIPAEHKIPIQRTGNSANRFSRPNETELVSQPVNSASSEHRINRTTNTASRGIGHQLLQTDPLSINNCHVQIFPAINNKPVKQAPYGLP